MRGGDLLLGFLERQQLPVADRQGELRLRIVRRESHRPLRIVHRRGAELHFLTGRSWHHSSGADIVARCAPGV